MTTATTRTLLAAALLGTTAAAQPAARRPLTSADVDDVARLERLEDRREFDGPLLTRLLSSSHPEVRRRAAITVGRIADRRGLALLRARPLDADTAIAAATVFAVGQLHDSSTTAWLDSLLSNPRAAAGVRAEAAAALGKLKSADARVALARFLSGAADSPRTTAAIGEALLAIGRTPRGDPSHGSGQALAPIVRWTRAPSEELRWRATWALFRPRDPASLATLLTMSADRSAHVRSWAVRGLTRPQADSAGVAAKAEAALLAAARDADRRVRTEAVRALGSYDTPAAVAALVTASRSPDAWIAVSALDGLARARGAEAADAVIAATAAGRSCAVRATALQTLGTVSPAAVGAAAARLARDATAYCRTGAMQAATRAASAAPLDSAAVSAIDALTRDATGSVRLAAWQAAWAARDATRGPETRRADRRFAFDTAGAESRAGALRAMTAWANASDLPWLLDVYERALRDSTPSAASAAVAVIAGVQRRENAGASQLFARFTAPPQNASLRRDVERLFDARLRPTWPAAAPVDKPLAEYRRIVERWVVPDYTGRPKPRVRWETPRGPIELELYAGDAPLATDAVVRMTDSGMVDGTEFTRVVPDFVDQQATVAGALVLRDEVNRRRLTRGNLAWATAGLDTGAPGYTLGHTPQPHNEGDFTSLGRIVVGMDAADRIELGDRVTAARVVRPPASLDAAGQRALLLDPEHPFWRSPAPDTARLRFETTKGAFVLETYRAWAPLGADRLYHFVQTGFFDDARFHRTVSNFIVQFGVPGDPAVTAVWNERPLRDDPGPLRSNVRGTFAYSMRGPNDRRTQLYVNLVDNVKNDTVGFALLGKVVEGMDVLDRLYSGYGETSGGGMRAGRQQQLLGEGNAWLDREFPLLDRLTRATVVRVPRREPSSPPPRG